MPPTSRPKRRAGVITGLVLLVLGADWLVEAAIVFAKALGVSEAIIGLTIVAVGTSLPEVATSVIAAVRGERDIAVGNVVGSNIFNILCVLGLSALVAPTALIVTPALLVFDLPVMIVVAFACLPIFFTGNLIARWEGMLFLLGYAAYLTYLIMEAVHHAQLETYSMAMAYFIGPVVMLTLSVIFYREWQQRRMQRQLRQS